MEAIAKIGSILGLSFICGINLYATIAVVGLSAKYHLVQGLPPEFNVLSNDLVITIAILLYLVEFLVDKVPGFDTLWDSIHTLIRPLGGAVLAMIQVGNASPSMEVVAFMVGASMASAAHFTKAGTRLLINTSPEPFSNIIVSILEDAGAITFAYVTLNHPVLSFFLTLCFAGGTIFLFPLIGRTIVMTFSSLLFRLKRLLAGHNATFESTIIPYRYDKFYRELAGYEEPLWAGPVFALRIPGVPRHSGACLVIAHDSVHILSRNWFKLRAYSIERQDILEMRAWPGSLFSRCRVRGKNCELSFLLYAALRETLPMGSGIGTRANAKPA